jgi:porin
MKRNLQLPVFWFALVATCPGLFAVLLAATAIAQSPANPADPAAVPASPSTDDSSFDDKATGDWLGERKRLDQAGLSFNPQLTLEGFDNFRGGGHVGIVGSSTFDLNMTLDTGKAFNWKGGEFYVDL